MWDESRGEKMLDIDDSIFDVLDFTNPQLYKVIANKIQWRYSP